MRELLFRRGSFQMRLAGMAVVAALFLFSSAALARDTASEKELYDQRIAEYTQKMKDANYPPLFEKAAQEFNVPADVLMAVSFAETRWTQLEWPPGETASPDTGMPHAYGIMSLWDNDYFGHTLQQAAKLIGQDPEVLKTDAFQNMRGGAALLRQLYDQTPKPEDAPNESQIESWREAIAKYTGIPQADLNEGHALRVYEYMNQGYNQYGIEWKGHPVNLGPMREAVERIRAAARAAKSTGDIQPSVVTPISSPPKAAQAAVAPAKPVVAAAAPITHGLTNGENIRQRWHLGILMAVLIAIAIGYLRRCKKVDG